MWLCLLMVCRLPVVLASGSRPGLTTLLARIIQQAKDLMQPPHPQPHHHHQQQQDHPTTSTEPAPKRQRAAETPGSSSSSSDRAGPSVVLDMLLTAYAAATGSAAAGHDAGWDWRLEFFGVLQELQPLHGPLFQRLLDALSGCEAGAAAVTPQQVGLSLDHHSRLQQGPQQLHFVVPV